MVVSYSLLSRFMATSVIPPSDSRKLYIVRCADSFLLLIAIHFAITVAIAGVIVWYVFLCFGCFSLFSELVR